MPTGTLRVTLIGAVAIPSITRFRTQSPFCILKINKAGLKATRGNTNTSGGVNPVWNQNFTFGAVSSDDTLFIEVFCEGLLWDEIIGTCELPLRHLYGKAHVEKTLPVITPKGEHKGDLNLELTFNSGSVPPDARGPAPLLNACDSTRSTLRSNSFRSNGTGRIPYPPIAPPTTQRPGGPWVLPDFANSDWLRDYVKGRELGPEGQYGQTFHCVHRTLGQQVAIKVIPKKRLQTPEEMQDVQREVQVMLHLNGHDNVVKFIRAYEDQNDIAIVTEFCSGGELLENIINGGPFSEQDAAQVMRTLLGTVAHMHSMGVVHRDIKPQNLLFWEPDFDSPLKLTGFGVATFFKEGEFLSEVLGTAFYVAPEVLSQAYSKESDIWSCGVILYLLLTGSPPFRGNTEAEIFRAIAKAPLVFPSRPPISDAAKDCIQRMLERDPSKRASAEDILRHDWMRENGLACDKPLELEVLNRIKEFSDMNFLKKEALRVMASHLTVDETAGLREMFLEIDKDRSGTITVDEFRDAIKKKGNKGISLADMAQFMEYVDLNGDGTIDYDEFLTAMVNSTGKLEREDRLRAAFDHFDLDGSGSISLDELMMMLSESGLDEDQIRETLKQVDEDGDEEIDFEEFCVMMRGRV